MHSDRGVSIVVGRRCPRSLLVAMANYGALPDVFARSPEVERRYAAFERWYERGLVRRGA